MRIIFGYLRPVVHDLITGILRNNHYRKVVDNYQNYDLEHMKDTMFQCFNKHSTVEVHLALDVYIHLFLMTALVIDMPLNSTSESSRKKELRYYKLRSMVLV
jgi:hypothetical protein